VHRVGATLHFSAYRVQRRGERSRGGFSRGGVSHSTNGALGSWFLIGIDGQRRRSGYLLVVEHESWAFCFGEAWAFAVNFAVLGLFVVYIGVLSLGLLRVCRGMSLESLVMMLLYHLPERALSARGQVGCDRIWRESVRKCDTKVLGRW